MRAVARWVGSILGALFILAGGVWALQGLRIINQGQMAGHRRWVAIGGLVVIIGIVLLIVANRRKAASAA